MKRRESERERKREKREKKEEKKRGKGKYFLFPFRSLCPSENPSFYSPNAPTIHIHVTHYASSPAQPLFLGHCGFITQRGRGKREPNDRQCVCATDTGKYKIGVASMPTNTGGRLECVHCRRRLALFFFIPGCKRCCGGGGRM